MPVTTVKLIFLFLSIFSIFDSARTTFLCPSYCKCTNEALDCSNGYRLNSSSLQTVPDTVVNISINNFIVRKLTESHFKKFSNLTSLMLTDCRIAIIAENSFNILPYLEVLNIHHNDLEEIPSHLFSNLTHLTTLNLGHNLISHLPETIFWNTTDVETLILSHNRLQLLPSGIFKKLYKLKHLDLSNNEISHILPSTFNYISHVRFINLESNLMVTIHEDLFDSNNKTVLTNLSLANNPLNCNCGALWLKTAILNELEHIKIQDSNSIRCHYPDGYHQQKLLDVPLGQLNCTSPTVSIVDASKDHLHANQVVLKCNTTGSPQPSVVWETPLKDLLSDPYQNQWLDGSINKTSPKKSYRVTATGDIVEFSVMTLPEYSELQINSLHLISSGVYKCIAMNPGGQAVASFDVSLVSFVDEYYYTSFLIAIATVSVATLIGIIGCSVTACIERCSCCSSMTLKYYDGAWMRCHLGVPSAADAAACMERNANHSNAEPHEADELLAGSSSEPSLSSHPYHGEINESTVLTAEEWDDYFRQFPDDFVVESFDTSPKKLGSSHGSPRGSPTHRSHSKTLETLEGVRVRLKLRVEQIDVMKERLRIHMEKRSARMKENMERRKMRMNKKMQTIKESTSQSLQSIKETGRSYSHKLHMGVRSAMENVGAQVLSLKEFCGTGDLGQTVSIATITTDIDTNEKTEVARTVTMV